MNVFRNKSSELIIKQMTFNVCVYSSWVPWDECFFETLNAPSCFSHRRILLRRRTF